MRAIRRRIGAAGFAGALATSTLAIGALAMAPSLPAGAAPVGTVLFSYNGTDGTDGSAQTYTVPANVCEVTIDAYGAGSGTDAFDTDGFTALGVADDVEVAAFEGKGAHVQSFISVTPGETLVVNVGGRGGDASATASVVDGNALGSSTAGLGGYNGGGDGGDSGASSNSQLVGVAGFGASGGGGGASDVRRSGGTLADRIVVAGGGGSSGFWFKTTATTGGGFNGTGGNGGAVGDDGTGGTTAGKGGTASAGGAGGVGAGANGNAGALGVGGDADSFADVLAGPTVFFSFGGAGGGGYYGGGSGAAVDPTEATVQAPYGGGGGGSSYSETLGIAESGVQSGNGMVVIAPSDPGVGCTSVLRVQKVVSGAATTGTTQHVTCTAPILASAGVTTIDVDLPYLADGSPDAANAPEGWTVVNGAWQSNDDLYRNTCTSTETVTGGATSVSYSCTYTPGANDQGDGGCDTTGPSATPATVFLSGGGDVALLTVTNTFPEAQPAAAAVTAQPRFTG